MTRTSRILPTNVIHLPVLPTDHWRPQTRAECAGEPRPCPYVGCVHHLYLSVMPDGKTIVLNFPEIEPDEMKHSCALDIADSGGTSPRTLAKKLGVSRQAVEQWEKAALVKLWKSGRKLREFR